MFPAFGFAFCVLPTCLRPPVADILAGLFDRTFQEIRKDQSQSKNPGPEWPRVRALSESRKIIPTSGRLFSGESLVAVQTKLCEFLGLLEKFGSGVREELVKRSETNLTLEEVLELGPIRLL